MQTAVRHGGLRHSAPLNVVQLSTIQQAFESKMIMKRRGVLVRLCCSERCAQISDGVTEKMRANEHGPTGL